jgi:DNA-directed RNA polymerase
MTGPDDREIMKQPAMSYFYGSEAGGFAQVKKGKWRGPWRPHGMTKQIVDVLKERKQPTSGAKELADAIYNAIKDMVPRAAEARDFLEELADLCAKEGKPLRWTTAHGLQVISLYHEPLKKTISVNLNGRRRDVNFVIGDKKDIWKTKAANSAAANFVHSADATHLQAVAIEAARAGIEMVCVHDCFGCLAPRARHFKTMIIPLQFVYLHRRNLLAEVLESAQKDLLKNTKLPPLPETGNLKLEDVLLNYNAFTN